MRNRKLFVQILAGIMAGVMLLGLVMSIIPTQVHAAKSSSQIKQEINNLKDEQMALWIQMDELEAEQDDNWESMEEMVATKDNIDQQINNLHTEMENINQQITGYSTLIAEKQTELDAATEKLNQLSEENKERIRAMEEEGKMSYWSVLFKASSFTDLIDRLNMIEEIAAADERRLAEMDAAAKEVAAAREELEAEKVELQASRAELDTVKAELDEKRVEADKILVELNEVDRELQEMYDEMAAEESALSASIAASEKAYNEAKKREEEERKKQEALQQQQNQQQNNSSSSSSSNNSSSNDSSSSSSSGSSSGEGWRVPCSYSRLTSAYGWRVHPITGKNSFHNGVDLAGAQGTPIYAAKSGTVTTATYSGAYGYYVTINHGDGYSTLYAHMTHYVVSSGQYVSQGQVIGYMGSTGWSTGPHLHYTVYYNGNTVNAANYI